jgi:hypothetical protein
MIIIKTFIKGLTFTFVTSFTLVNILDDGVTKVPDPFHSKYPFQIPQIYHFSSYVIMAHQWVTFQHQTKYVPYSFLLYQPKE